MNGGSSKHNELHTLMDQALQISVALQKYSDESFGTFLSEDDEKIAEVISNREKMIETLVGIEYKTDIILDESEEYDYGKALPPDIEKIRRSVRAVLNDVSVKDMEIMKLIGSKMQKYKTETLKARNKKSLSAYMKTAFSDEPGDSIDLKK
jgi:hypothetical protein